VLIPFIIIKSSTGNAMYAISPQNDPAIAADHPDTEYYSDLIRAYDNAYDYSVVLHGQPIFLFKVGSPNWNPLTFVKCWSETLRGRNPPPILYTSPQENESLRCYRWLGLWRWRLQIPSLVWLLLYRKCLPCPSRRKGGLWLLSDGCSWGWDAIYDLCLINT